MIKKVPQKENVKNPCVGCEFFNLCDDDQCGAGFEIYDEVPLHSFAVKFCGV